MLMPFCMDDVRQNEMIVEVASRRRLELLADLIAPPSVDFNTECMFACVLATSQYEFQDSLLIK